MFKISPENQHKNGLDDSKDLGNIVVRLCEHGFKFKREMKNQA